MAENETPRRVDLLRSTPAELTIRDALIAVEDLGADERLTSAVQLLDQARELVADVVDERIAAGTMAAPQWPAIDA